MGGNAFVADEYKKDAAAETVQPSADRADLIAADEAGIPSSVIEPGEILHVEEANEDGSLILADEEGEDDEDDEDEGDDYDHDED